MSQDETLALLKTFGPLSVSSLASCGMCGLQSNKNALTRLKKAGQVWHMAGRAAKPGRGALGIWGAI